MPLVLHRTRTNSTERITLVGAYFTVTVELLVTGLELDAGTVERMLHAPLGIVAERVTERKAG